MALLFCLLTVQPTLLQVNLSHNRLCGVWDEAQFGRLVKTGTYTAEGIKAIADALRVSASLTLVR